MRSRRVAAAGRSRVGVAVLVAGVLALTGCAGSTPPGTEPSAVQTDPLVDVADLSGGVSTTLTLDPGFTGALRTAGVVLSGAREATLSAGVLTLPISGGSLEVFDKLAARPYVQGRVEHRRSGLTLRTTEAEVRLLDLVMLPGRSLVTGAVADGDAVTPADVFFLDGSTLQPLRRERGRTVLDGTRVSLHPAGAALLRRALGLSPEQLPDRRVVGIAKLIVAGPD